MTPAKIVTPSFLRDWPLPAPGSSKSSRGRAVIIGGSRRVPGAAQLSGLAALRVGAGVLTMAVAESVAVALAVATPEAGVIGLPENERGSVTGAGLDRFQGVLEDADAVLVGPGLDGPDTTLHLLRKLVPLLPSQVPVVLDAFALGVLGDVGELVGELRGRLVLTPNTEEVGRLLGRDIDDVSDDLVAEVARRFGAVVSCQQHIVDQDGNSWRGSSGHGGLGTSGSGDVLAGAICGLLARGAELDQAACWGTHLHATAGDRLAIEIGPLGFLARELVTRLPAVMAELTTS
jgi:hydroxyethylthiazole kinase-like uncharacterized protein yjeF